MGLLWNGQSRCRGAHGSAATTVKTAKPGLSGSPAPCFDESGMLPSSTDSRQAVIQIQLQGLTGLGRLLGSELTARVGGKGQGPHRATPTLIDPQQRHPPPQAERRCRALGLLPSLLQGRLQQLIGQGVLVLR